MTSQLNINPAAATGFLPDCYFSRSIGRRPIFLTLNKVINSPSGHLTITAGRLFSRQPILSSNDQLFDRYPAGTPCRSRQRRSSGLPAVTSGSPVDHCRTAMNATNIFQQISGQHCLLCRPVRQVRSTQSIMVTKDAMELQIHSNRYSAKNVKLIPVKDCVQTIKHPNCAIEFLLIL